MKSNISYITIILYTLIYSLTSCYNCKTGDDPLLKFRFRDSSGNFIPNITNPVTFQSDSNKTMVFEDVRSPHEFKDFYPCNEESCCDPINHERKTLNYWSSANNLSFAVHILANDSADILTVSEGIIEFPSSKSNYVSRLIYTEEENIVNILNNKSKHCTFMDTLFLGNTIFYKVFVFQGKSEEPKKFAETLYYTKKQGIIGYILNDKSLWLKK